MNLPKESRFRLFDPRVHENWQRNKQFPDYVEVPMHIETKDGWVPNPEYINATYARSFIYGPSIDL